ncbi:MAG TPA: glycosyltransferase family 39 protein [Elusimicrobiota bacterium]|jgi:4-amino-4-deoxy-L-arabinose transferase-like glycosyltransferase|nr:glycosyltransferase family 39 protein [Elusimicrobiota bacterium]
MTPDALPSRDRRWLAALILAGLVLRGVYCWKFPQWGPGHSIPDLNWYETIAESLYHHGTISDPSGNLTAAREPGYPLLLAGIYLVTGPSYRAGQAANCVFGCLTILLIFLMGRAVFGRRTAWLAAVIATFYPQFLYYTATLERETFQTFLLALTVWLILRASRVGTLRSWIAPGIVSACCALTNSALLPAGLMLAPAIWLLGRRLGRERLRGACVYLGIMLLVCSTWTLRNERVFHRFILGINGGGAHMYVGIIVPNDAAGTPAEAAFLDSDPVSREAAKLPEAEADRVFYRGALLFIREHPARYAGVALRSLAKLWRLYPYARAYAYHYELIKWVGLLSDGWIIPLGFLGMLLAGRRFPEAEVFLAVLFSVTFTYMLFWSIIRYRLPMMPFTILFCAYALTRFSERVLEARA